MSPLKDFALLAKLEELDLESHKIVKLWEKSERHVLSADIRHLNGELLQLVIEAVKMQQEERKARRPLVETRKLLRRIDVKIEFYKIQVRKAFNLRLINERQYESWSRGIKEIGGLLGGWVKSVDNSLENRSAGNHPASGGTPATQGKLL